MSDDVLLRVEGLTRRYGDTRVVNDVNFTLARGQILGFLGPNGAGKSTTLRLLAGVLAPDAGRVVIANYDLLDQPIQAKRAVGYLPEQPPLYRELTVDEQLLYSAHLHGLGRAASRLALTRVKERCGLAEVGKRLTGNLSKGYRQRVGIAQAILHDPPLILLDEPTVGLDPIQLRDVRRLIRKLGESRGIILSTHLLTEVQAVCSHVQIMRAGQLVYAGALTDLEGQPESRSLRIGLRAPPPLATLAELPGIKRVEALGVGQFRLYHGSGDTQRAVVERSVTEGWGLWELVPEQNSLERVFVELTLGGEITQ